MGDTSHWPQVNLPRDLPILGAMMASAGYATPYRGKGHCSTPPARQGSDHPNDVWFPEEANRYGFEGWGPPSAGEDKEAFQFGGRTVNNDGPYVESRTRDKRAIGIVIFPSRTRRFCATTNPRRPSSKVPKDYMVFTCDDYQSGQKGGFYQGPNNHGVSIIEERCKLAKYFSLEHSEIPWEWAISGPAHDPLETHNPGSRGCQRTPEEDTEFVPPQQKLKMAVQTGCSPCLPGSR